MGKIGAFLLASNRNAAIVALVFALLPLINLPGGLFASIIVGLVTLRKGYKSGLFVLAWVALPAISLLVLKRFGISDILLFRCVLVWLFAMVLRTYKSWRLVLEVATVIGIATVLVLHALNPDMQGWWTQYFNSLMKEVTQTGAWQMAARDMGVAFKQIVPFATGFFGFFVLFGTLVELLLARWWETAMFSPGALRKEFTNIRMGYTAAFIMLLAVIGIFFKLDVIIDLFPILLLPFMICGLSLLHMSVEWNKNMFIPAVFVYLGLVIFSVLMVILLALAGYIDSWVNFRERLFKTNASAK